MPGKKKIKRRQGKKDWLQDMLRPASQRKDITKTARGVPLDRMSRAQHGKIYDPSSKQTGTYALSDEHADQELAEAVAEEMAEDRSRRWIVRAIFGFHRNDDETMTMLRKVGVFTILPSVPPAEMERRLILMPFREREEAVKEILEKWKNIHEGKYFFVDDNPPPGNNLARLDKGGLLQLMLTLWRSHPINTMGDLELVYPDGHIEIKVTREKLINSTEREKLFEHLNHVMELMRQGFKYDPRVHLDKGSHEGVLRRMGNRGPEPWSRDR